MYQWVKKSQKYIINYYVCKKPHIALPATSYNEITQRTFSKKRKKKEKLTQNLQLQLKLIHWENQSFCTVLGPNYGINIWMIKCRKFWEEYGRIRII